MKRAAVVLLLVTAVWAQGSSSSLPPACGADNVSFNVKEDSAPQPLPPVESGKARVYFIQDDGPGGKYQHATVRIGVDGAWVGAYKHNSSFAISVDPGEHHVCATVQSEPWNLALAHFTAEAGKAYYFRTQFLAGLRTLYPTYPNLLLERPDSDQAMYLIANFPRSVSQPGR
jgi:hypothetical protein